MKKTSLLMIMACLYFMPVKSGTPALTAEPVEYLRKGDNLLGLHFGLSYQGGKDITAGVKTDQTTYMDFNLGVDYSHMLTNKMSLGLNVGYSMGHTKVPDYSTTNSSEFRLDPNIRLYQPFGEQQRGGLMEEFNIGVGFGMEKYKPMLEVDETEDRTLNVGAGVGFGGFYCPTPCTRFYGCVGAMDFEWESTHPKGDKDYGSSDFFFDSALSTCRIKIGFEAVLGRHVEAQ